MRTQKQIDASRRNGAKSRGPATPEGKAISSRNSLRHGLRSRDPLRELVVDPATLADRRAAYTADLNPGCLSEEALVERLAMSDALIEALAKLENATLAAEIARIAPAHPHATEFELNSLAFASLLNKYFYDSFLRVERKIRNQYERDLLFAIDLHSRSSQINSDDRTQAPASAEAFSDDRTQTSNQTSRSPDITIGSHAGSSCARSAKRQFRRTNLSRPRTPILLIKLSPRPLQTFPEDYALHIRTPACPQRFRSKIFSIKRNIRRAIRTWMNEALCNCVVHAAPPDRSMRIVNRDAYNRRIFLHVKSR